MHDRPGDMAYVKDKGSAVHDSLVTWRRVGAAWAWEREEERGRVGVRSGRGDGENEALRGSRSRFELVPSGRSIDCQIDRRDGWIDRRDGWIDRRDGWMIEGMDEWMDG